MPLTPNGTYYKLNQPVPDDLDVCYWKLKDDHYETTCNQAFSLNDEGTLANHRIKFCCFCGDPIVELPFLTESMYDGFGFGK